MARVVSYLIGAFVCVELVYLPLSNVALLVPREPRPVPDELLVSYQATGRVSESASIQETIEAIGSACDRWGEATAQVQGWSLFAPTFGKCGTFLTLQVTSSDGEQLELRSPFEPADVEHYTRFDARDYRLFYREMSYALVYSNWSPEAFERQGEAWRNDVREYVTVFRRSLTAHVRWRLEQAGLTDATRVVVAVRVFPPPERGGPGRPPPVMVPLARWDAERPDELAAYDPVTKGFGK